MSRQLSSECIYTIVHRDRLEEALRGAGTARFHEAVRWVSAARMLAAAREEHQVLPLLFADAAAASPLICWGEVAEITLDPDGTEVVVTNLQRIQGTHMPSELTLLRRDANLSSDDIRPYRLCRTPVFLSSAVPRPA